MSNHIIAFLVIFFLNLEVSHWLLSAESTNQKTPKFKKITKKAKIKFDEFFENSRYIK